MKKGLLLLTIGLIVLLTACTDHPKVSETSVPTTQPVTTASTVPQETVQPTAAPAAQPQTTAPVSTEAPKEEIAPTEQAQEEPDMTLRMTIGTTPVSVSWEDNDAAEALKELCRNGSLTISMSMYGGFEQVGSIGASLPQNDVQTTTSAGDIVLYAGDQLVVFYGSNTWAYTRLGHITDQDADGMAQLLSNGDTTLTLSLE